MSMFYDTYISISTALSLDPEHKISFKFVAKFRRWSI